MATDAIIFDLDGTLWDAVPEILYTWNMVIASEGNGVRGLISMEEQFSLMGHTMDEIARRLFPSLDAETRNTLMDHCMAAENEYLYHHGGTLYPELESTLKKLSAHYRLFIVSNCQSGYIEAFLHAHQLSSLFDGHICFGDNRLSKCNNIGHICRKYNLSDPIYVGDTIMDFNSANDAGVRFIFAAYGYGTVEHPEMVIHEFKDLCVLLPCESDN